MLDILGGQPNSPHLLDIGCGTGELVIAASSRGVIAHGIDYSPEMIVLCEVAKSAANITNARFDVSSIFDFDSDGQKYDVVSALGLIEYMTIDQVDEIIKKSKSLLKSEGRFVIASRNRLFNIFSANEFTEMEAALGTTARLLTEIRQLVAAGQLGEYLDVATAEEEDYVQPDSHPRSWIGVARRPQYTPRELARRLACSGFVVEQMIGIHFHAMPPIAARANMEFYRAVSERMFADYPQTLALIPQCTSFVLVAGLPR